MSTPKQRVRARLAQIHGLMEAAAPKFTVGQRVKFDGTSADGRVTGVMPVTIVDPHSNASAVTYTDKRGREYEGARSHLPTATVRNDRGTTFEASHYSLKSL